MIVSRIYSNGDRDMKVFVHNPFDGAINSVVNTIIKTIINIHMI